MTRYEYELIHYPIETRGEGLTYTLGIAGDEGWCLIQAWFDDDHKLASALFVREKE